MRPSSFAYETGNESVFLWYVDLSRRKNIWRLHLLCVGYRILWICRYWSKDTMQRSALRSKWAKSLFCALLPALTVSFVTVRVNPTGRSPDNPQLEVWYGDGSKRTMIVDSKIPNRHIRALVFVYRTYLEICSFTEYNKCSINNKLAWSEWCDLVPSLTYLTRNAHAGIL